MSRPVVKHVCQGLRLKRITPEIDDSAVGFCRKCGLAITSLGQEYPGVERFLCELILES